MLFTFNSSHVLGLDAFYSSHKTFLFASHGAWPPGVFLVATLKRCYINICNE